MLTYAGVYCLYIRVEYPLGTYCLHLKFERNADLAMLTRQIYTQLLLLSDHTKSKERRGSIRWRSGVEGRGWRSAAAPELCGKGYVATERGEALPCKTLLNGKFTTNLVPNLLHNRYVACERGEALPGGEPQPA
jgi:hypothetical protein